MNKIDKGGGGGGSKNRIRKDPWRHAARSHQKFGPDQFGRFDAYWIQTNKETDRRVYIYIYKCNSITSDLFLLPYSF